MSARQNPNLARNGPHVHEAPSINAPAILQHHFADEFLLQFLQDRQRFTLPANERLTKSIEHTLAHLFPLVLPLYFWGCGEDLRHGIGNQFFYMPNQTL